MPKRNVNGFKWVPGEKAFLAKKAGVHKSTVTNLLKRRMCASALTARRLEEACRALKIPITRLDWMEAKYTDNQLFE